MLKRMLNSLLGLFCLLFFSQNLNAQSSPQDIKNDGPIRITFWDMDLPTGAHAVCRRVFYVTNTSNAAVPLQYVAFQIPNGMIAEAPVGTWAAPGVAPTPAAPAVNFVVRNPTFSPHYGIRFEAPANYTMAAGETRSFTITTPGHVGCPWYTRVTVRVKPKIFYSVLIQRKKEIGSWDENPGEIVGEMGEDRGADLVDFTLSPNPASSGAYADLSVWTGENVKVRLFDLQGKLAKEWNLTANDAPEFLDFEGLGNGVYLVQVISDSEPAAVRKIVIQKE